MTSIFRNCDEFRHGWPIVLSASVGIGLGVAPVPFYTIGVFAPELAREFGWGFGQIMFGIMVMTITALIVSPLVGHLADRFGVRRVVMVSIVLFAISFSAFAFTTGSLLQFYLTWAVVAALGSGTLPITWTRTVNMWFDRKKGLALGLALVGTGVFGALLKPITVWLITELGWRGAYLVVAILPVFIALPVTYIFFRERKASSGAGQSLIGGSFVYAGHSVKQMIKDRRFWLLMAATLPISFALSGPIPNMENLLAHQGFTINEIARVVPLIGISVLAGRIFGGILLDYFWAPAVAFALLLLPVLAFSILMQSSLGLWAAMVAVFLTGFAAGVEYDLLAYMIARYFGVRSYSTIYGFVYGAYVLGAGFGPVVFGIVFDKNQSYDHALSVAIIMVIAGAFLLLSMGQYNYPKAAGIDR